MNVLFWVVSGGCGIYFTKLAYLTRDIRKLYVEYIIIRIGESGFWFKDLSCLFGLL